MASLTRREIAARSAAIINQERGSKGVFSIEAPHPSCAVVALTPTPIPRPRCSSLTHSFSHKLCPTKPFRAPQFYGSLFSKKFRALQYSCPNTYKSKETSLCCSGDNFWCSKTKTEHCSTWNSDYFKIIYITTLSPERRTIHRQS